MRRLRWSGADAAVALAFAAAVATFAQWPRLDLVVSQAFWQEGSGFTWAQHPLVTFVYVAVPWVGRVLLVGLAAAWLYGLARPAQVARRRRLQAALLLGTAVFGLGLFIDIGLKDHWGRPRPRDTVEFGGPQAFQPALLPTGECRRNCSFVSGHAAFGFFVLTGGMLAAPHRRRRWLVAALVAGSAIGLGRIAQGGHYLSDIVFSFFAVWLSAHAVWMTMLALQRWRAWRRALRRRPPAKRYSGSSG